MQKIHTILGVMPECYQDVDFRQLYQLKEKYPEIRRRQHLPRTQRRIERLRPREGRPDGHVRYRYHDDAVLCGHPAFHGFRILHFLQFHGIHIETEGISHSAFLAEHFDNK